MRLTSICFVMSDVVQITEKKFLIHWEYELYSFSHVFGYFAIGNCKRNKNVIFAGNLDQKARLFSQRVYVYIRSIKF